MTLVLFFSWCICLTSKPHSCLSSWCSVHCISTLLSYLSDAGAGRLRCRYALIHFTCESPHTCRIFSSGCLSVPLSSSNIHHLAGKEEMFLLRVARACPLLYILFLWCMLVQFVLCVPPEVCQMWRDISLLCPWFLVISVRGSFGSYVHSFLKSELWFLDIYITQKMTVIKCY